MRTLVLSIIAIAAFGYAGIVALVGLFQDRLLFFSSTTLDSTPAGAGLEYEDIWLDTDEDARIHGWYVRAAIPSSRTVLFLHGNAGNISHRIYTVSLWHQLGFNCFLIDYRGYGRSTGKPSEIGLRTDALAAWRYLLERRNIPATQIVVHGRSLGAAVALSITAPAQTQTAPEQLAKPGAVILESTFTSLPDIGARAYPWLPIRWLSRFSFPSQQRIANLDAPVLVAHSLADELIPFAHGQTLYNAARAPKQFFTMRGGHASGYVDTGRDYQRTLADFVKLHISDQADTASH